MSRIFAKTRHRTQAAPSAAFGFKTVVVMGVLTLVFGVGYLAQISSAASKGDQIRSLERNVAELRTEKEKLELKMAADQSVRSVSKKVEELGLVATTHVDYVSPTTPVVAKR